VLEVESVPLLLNDDAKTKASKPYMRHTAPFPPPIILSSDTAIQTFVKNASDSRNIVVDHAGYEAPLNDALKVMNPPTTCSVGWSKWPGTLEAC